MQGGELSSRQEPLVTELVIQGSRPPCGEGRRNMSAMRDGIDDESPPGLRLRRASCVDASCVVRG